MRNAGAISYLAMIAWLSVSALAQNQFIGTWQGRISPASGKHSITVDIAVKEGRIGGTVVLVDGFDGSETESPIINPELSGSALKFETNVKDAIFNWELTLEGSREARLRGSYGHMLIDEHVVKKDLEQHSSQQERAPTETSKPVTVGMISLLADPDKYSAIRIRTFGFLSIEIENTALYLQEEDYGSGLGKNALELNLTQEQEKQFKSLSLKYVVIEGTVVSTRASVEHGLSGGALGKITRVELWQPRAPLRDPRSK